MQEDEYVVVSEGPLVEERIARLMRRNRLLCTLLGWKLCGDHPYFEAYARTIQRSWRRTRRLRQVRDGAAMRIQLGWRVHRCMIFEYSAQCAMEQLSAYVVRRRRRCAAVCVQRAFRAHRAPVCLRVETLRRMVRDRYAAIRKNEQLSRVMMKMLNFVSERLDG